MEVGGVTETRERRIGSLTSLTQHHAVDIDRLYFLVVLVAGDVDVIHSYFLVEPEECKGRGN